MKPLTSASYNELEELASMIEVIQDTLARYSHVSDEYFPVAIQGSLNQFQTKVLNRLEKLNEE